ncbi:hypothetical protein EGW08_016034, partial [Elysia chlorotica]
SRIELVLGLILLHSVVPLQDNLVTCRRGQYLEAGKNGGRDKCSMCPTGQFQDKVYHREMSCNRCSIFDVYTWTRRILEDDCTRFHDIIYICKEGFYRNNNGDCYNCVNCKSLGKFEAQACTERENAVCCDKEGMKVKAGKCVAPEDYDGPETTSQPEQYKIKTSEVEPSAGGGAGSGDSGGGLSTGQVVAIVIAALIIGLVVGFLLGYFCRTVINFLKALCEPLYMLVRRNDD